MSKKPLFNFKYGQPLGSMSPKGNLAFLLGLALAGMATYSWAEGAVGPYAKNWLNVDLIKLLHESDALGKISLVILLIFSVCSLMVIVFKFWHIRQASVQTEAFVEVCNQGSGQLEEAFQYTANFPDSPLAQILREAYIELEAENWYREGYDIDQHTRIELAKVSMERVFERTIANEITHLESKLVFLATTASVCPFIGLFGTVWGVMVAFQSLSDSQGASLTTLGPGIATALLCVIGGLVCAIPATVMYNYLAHRVRVLTSRMDAFAHELSNVIQKQVMKQASAHRSHSVR